MKDEEEKLRETVKFPEIRKGPAMAGVSKIVGLKQKRSRHLRGRMLGSGPHRHMELAPLQFGVEGKKLSHWPHVLHFF